MKEIDIIYPLKAESFNDFEELKFSLRSIDKYLHDYAKIWIIGEKLPSWIKNVEQIKIKDTNVYRSQNVTAKLVAVCEHAAITDEFLLMNDDFFFNHTRVAPEYPYFHKGLIEDSLKTMSLSGYYRMLENTVKILKRKGFGTRHFGIHLPMRMRKDSLAFILQDIDWMVNNGYSVRCLYGNILSLEATFLKDPKIYNPLDDVQTIKMKTWNYDCFSTNERAFNEVMVKFLSEKFPEKSQYEK